MNQNEPIDSGTVQPTFETAVAVKDHATNYTDIESLDQQVKSMMMFSENAATEKGRQGRARICKVCGKEGGAINIKNHIEANHITGISIPCDLCEKSFKSRNSVAVHKYNQHRNNQ